MSDASFPDLIARVRAGDETAAATLVRQYEPEIRRVVRVRLTDRRLHRVLDSMDICQSVMANFFARAALGQFDLEQPDQLLRLLVTMARNKLKDHARKQKAARRDNRRLEGGEDVLAEVPGVQDTPSQEVAGKEMLVEIRKLLTEEERFLADQRALGRDWADIAAEHGGRADALRVKLSRAIDRVTKQLGME